MASEPKVAELTIRMDGHTLCFTHSYRGSHGLLIPMVGACEFVQDWMKGEVRNFHDGQNGGLCAEDNPNSLEVEVSRDVALDLYWNALEKMRDRLLSIDKSDPHATFHIDPSLLKRL